MEHSGQPVETRGGALQRLLRERIVILDGAMGTMIQTYRLDEAGYRGQRFKDWRSDLKGNNDLLNLTRPDVVGAICNAYVDAGADLLATNTFNANAISLGDYGISSMAQISRDALELARQAMSEHHYPDGFVLFLGTLFAPTQDRDTPGQGFTHKEGDVVRISTPKLGVLENKVTSSKAAPPWTFGITALMKNLVARGLLSA